MLRTAITTKNRIFIEVLNAAMHKGGRPTRSTG
jgi:hypothetical protein